MNSFVVKEVNLAKQEEKVNNWKSASIHWKRAKAHSDEAEYSEYIQSNYDACIMLHEAAELGRKLRLDSSKAMEDLNNLPEDCKKRISWMIKGAKLKILTKEARLELYQFYNQYPSLPVGSIIDWGLKEYEKWEV